MHKTYKVIRLAGTSSVSYEDAINNAISDAGESVRGLNWFQVAEQRGRVDESGKIGESQVVVDIQFKIEA